MLCVQDIVHIGIKLKARLLKPSIVLPLGSFIATSSHLHMLLKLCGKDQHGLRNSDLDHKDKQNFSAVENIIKASSLLDMMPDAEGTKCFVDMMSSAIYSFLDKNMSPLQRIHEIWYATFFLKYWRQWLSNSTKFTLKDNFITTNAYVCVEINAHALLAFLIITKDATSNIPESCFMPWMMGSQTCEMSFRALRSMTGTFSTMINFTMRDLLQRLHKLHIQNVLQSESDSLGIIFPRQQRSSKKSGHGSYSFYSCSNFSDNEIYQHIMNAELRAKETIEKLGMAEELKKFNMWDTPPLPPNLSQLLLEPEDGSDEVISLEDDSKEHLPSDERVNMATDVKQRFESNIVDDSVQKKALQLEKVESDTIPMFKEVPLTLGDAFLESQSITDSSPYVKVKIQGKKTFAYAKVLLYGFSRKLKGYLQIASLE